MFPQQKMSFSIFDTLILGDIRKQVPLHKHGPELEEKLIKDLRISSEALEIVEWERLKISMGKLSTTDRIPKMKLIHHQYPTQQYLHIQKQTDSPICPRCNKCPKTFEHIFQCTSHHSKTIHRNAIRKLLTKLQKAGTAKLVTDALATLLNTFHTQTRAHCPHPILHSKKHLHALRPLFLQQHQLGPTSVHKGFLARNWTIVQNICKNEKHVCKKNLGWLKNIICALWTFSHEIWVERCKHSNKADKSNPLTLSHCDLLTEIRNYLQLPKNELSADKRKLHYNVTGVLKRAHRLTLVKWLDLFRAEREATIRQKRTERSPLRGGMRSLRRYFSILH